MRAYSWFLVGSFALACSGGAFTSVPEGSGGTSNGEGGDSTSEGASAGLLGKAGRGIGGSLMGSGGKVAVGGTGNLGGGNTGGMIDTGGVIGFGGEVGIGGDLVVGGSLSMGGGTVVGGSGTSGGAVGTGGTGPDPLSACPVTAPAPNSMCVAGLSCSYGADIRPSCRPKATCNNGKWLQADPTCPAIHGCSGDATPDGPCDMQVNTACIRGGTQYCACSLCAGNLCSNQPTWHCATNSGDLACPKIAPNDGSACASNMKCLYGSCTLPQSGPIVATCDGKTWTWEPSVCAF